MSLSYSGIFFSSNAALSACQRADDARRAPRTFDEPEIRETLEVPSASATTLAVPAPVASEPGRACHAGLVGSGSAAVDVMRLGVLCGPSTGLEAWTEPAVLALGERPVVRRLELASDDCVRIAVSAGRSQPVDVAWVAAGRVLARCSLPGFGMCPESGPLCLAAGEFDRPSVSLELTLASTGDAQGVLRVFRRSR